MLIGIIGKTNTGKSTFFKATTLAEVEIANRPFVTLKPNHGIGYVKVECIDKFFKVKCNPREGYCINENRFVPVELLDVAGLVPGAHEGKGMGNQFLDDLNQADALIHIIDVSGSTNEQGEPVEIGSYDPANDIKFLETELDYWYLRIIKKGWEDLAKKMKVEKTEPYKVIAKQLSGLRVTEEIAKKATKNFNEDPTRWTDEDLMNLAIELRKITKPMIIACNKIDVKKGQENFEKLKKQFKEHILIPCSAESELALKEAAKNKLINYIPGENKFEIIGKLNDVQKAGLEFIKKNVLDLNTTGVQEILDKIVFEILNYIAVFPVPNSRLEDKDGNKLPDCYLVPPTTTPIELAYKIHTEMGKKFIKAIDLKTKRIISKDYKIKHRDVIEIVI